MQVATGAPTRAQVEEEADRLVVHFPPSRSWFAVAFLLVLLTFWAGGAVNVVNSVLTGESRAALLFLGPWALGAYFLVKCIARVLWEHEFLVATLDRVKVSRELGGHRRSQKCPVRLLLTVRAVDARDAEDPDTDCEIEIVHRDGEIRLGQGLDRREAEYLASVTRSWLRRHAGWVDAGDVGAAAGRRY